MTITLLAPDGVAVTAQQERQANAAVYGGGAGRPLGGRSGFRVDTPSNVLTATATTWTLGPCSAMIDPGASTHQGMYGWASDANITGSVTAADSTNARKDIIYIQVNDSSAGDGSGAKTANVSYLAGVASTTPAAPALPARSFLVGTIDVPKAGAGGPVVTLNPARFAAAGAPLPATLAERDALSKYDTLEVRRTDVPGRPREVWDGAMWWPEFEPKTALTLVTANYQADPPRGDGLAQEPPSCYRAGKRVRMSGVASNKITITFTGGTEYILGYLPAGYRPAKVEYFAIEVAFTTCRVWVRPDGEIRFMFGSTISNLAAPLGRFSLSGISFDAA